MAIGRWKCVALNVTDMEKGRAFWSAVLGWEESREPWHGWIGALRDQESDNYMILIETNVAPIETAAPTHHETNRMHIDIWPNEGMDSAVADIVAIGGTLKKPPSLYPRPGAHGDEAPSIDWAVMQDPFGNEFCIVEQITPAQGADAMASGATNDHDLRVAAGVTLP
jgi:catechol 2,3-dioxygenase-like lactoylglutathione lyase family enzyme